MSISVINLLLVATGGAIGCVFRYILTLLLSNFSKGQIFPISTIFVNIVGSLLVGVVHFILINYFQNISFHIRLFLVMGLLGGFTTFSTFSLDILRLLHAGQFNIAFTYAISSVLLSVIAIFFGFYLTSVLMR